MTKPKKTFYNDLEEGLQDIIDYKKGKIHLRSEDIDIPELPEHLQAIICKKERPKPPFFLD